MSLQAIRTLVLDLVILGALGVGGWFVGAELFAHKAGTSAPLSVASEVEGAETSDGTLVVPLTGLSPFGQNSGLEGRQVMVGRVREVGEGFFVADTPIGPARFSFADDSTFLLRLSPGTSADLEPGAAVAVLAASGGEGAFEAASVLILPQESRPSIRPPPPLFGGDPTLNADDIEDAGFGGGGDDQSVDEAGADEEASGEADSGASEAASDGDGAEDSKADSSADAEPGDGDDETTASEVAPAEEEPEPAAQVPVEAVVIALDTTGLLPVGEEGDLGSLSLRLSRALVSGGSEPVLSGLLLLSNESSRNTTTPPVVAICQTGVEVGVSGAYRVGRPFPSDSLLMREIRFALPPGCGPIVVEARAGDDVLGWYVLPPDRIEAVALAELPDTLQATLDSERRRYNTMGSSLAVAAPGLDVWSGGSGVADREAGEAVDSDSVFRIGELTQMFVAVAALQLVDEGLLELDATLGEAFPAIPNSDRITLRHLLNHTSGLDSFEIQSFNAAFFSDPRQVWEPAQVLSFFSPIFADEPGGWDHSGTNYLLVALLIEEATGRPVEEEVQRRLLDPLGLDATRWVDQENPPVRLVSAYSRLGISEIDQAEYTALATGFGPSWGMVSTAEDLAVWMRALGSGDLLSQVMLTETQEFVKGPGDVEAGLGIYAFQNDYGPGLGYRSEGAGNVSLAFYLRDQDVAVVLLANQTDAPTGRLTTTVLEVVLGEPPA